MAHKCQRLFRLDRGHCHPSGLEVPRGRSTNQSKSQPSHEGRIRSQAVPDLGDARRRQRAKKTQVGVPWLHDASRRRAQLVFWTVETCRKELGGVCVAHKCQRLFRLDRGHCHPSGLEVPRGRSTNQSKSQPSHEGRIRSQAVPDLGDARRRQRAKKTQVGVPWLHDASRRRAQLVFWTVET